MVLSLRRYLRSPLADALAGGFEIQQSAYFQGMSFAGVATGGPSLASMAWNPASSVFASYGLTVKSSYAVVLPEADITVANPGAQLPPPGTDKVDIGRDTLLGASFAAWRLNEKTVVRLELNLALRACDKTRRCQLGWKVCSHHQ